MKDFQNMFPAMDPDVIEAVLRANNGEQNELTNMYFRCTRKRRISA